MADFQAPSSGKGRRKLSTLRIDLTPMVDLGFLLITFFMYTTTLAKPGVMEIAVPPRNVRGDTEVPEEATLVILPTAAHKMAYYPGTEQSSLNLRWSSISGRNGLRSLLEAESARIKGLPAGFSIEAHKLHVLIKPDTSASYDDIVSVLDEMNIGAVPYYVLMHITPDEQAAIKKFQVRSYGK